MINRFEIGKIRISIINKKKFLKQIEEFTEKHITGYICVTNSRTAYLSNTDDAYYQIQNNSLLTVPDGTPLIWIAHHFIYIQ